MSEPEYIVRARRSPDYADKTHVQIELELAAMPAVDAFTGHTNHFHRSRAMELLFPSRYANPWRDRMVNGYQRCKDEGRKEYMILGASNSTKTSTIADTLIEIWLECPEATSIYLASPYEDATQTGLWARVVEQFEEAKSLHPELPGRIKFSENKIVLYDNNPLSFIRVATVDQVGKLVGKKAKSFNVGMLIIASDELPEFKQGGRPLIRVMNNLQSVPNMMLIGAGNFASPQDALGVFCEPDIPGGYHGLRLRQHYEWQTSRGGLVLRFDGDQSPALAEPKKYFFLPTADYRDRLAKTSGGKTSADFFRYWHSFPLVGSEEFTVTNINKVRASGALDERYQWAPEPLTLGCHCDPGFGGDAAVVQRWRLGRIITPDNSTLQIIEAWGPPEIIPIDVTSGVDVNVQIVIGHRKIAEQYGIPVGNCSFDGSLRASIVQQYGKSWSPDVIAFDSGGSATTRPTSVVKEIAPDGQEIEAKTWKDKVTNLITEQWMVVDSLLISGQIRGLAGSLETTVAELCKRQWKWEGKKKKLETKIEFKANNAGKSPNAADAFVGGVECARRRGLILHGVVRTEGGSLKLLLSMRENMTATHAMNLARGIRPALPSGTLHVTSRQTHSRRSGRLNR